MVEEVKNPHNISAILRTADAAGLQHVCIIDPLGEGFNVNEAISTGAEKWLTIDRFYSAKLCFESLRRKGFRIAATTLEGNPTPIYEYDFTRRVAVVLGNEKRGVRKHTLEIADDRIIIPMRGMVQSLNVSVSAGIILFEAVRQRLQAGLKDPLPGEEVEELLRRWR